MRVYSSVATRLGSLSMAAKGDTKTVVKGDEPVVVQFRDVTAAAYRIKKGVKETPLEVVAIIFYYR